MIITLMVVGVPSVGGPPDASFGFYVRERSDKPDQH